VTSRGVAQINCHCSIFITAVERERAKWAYGIGLYVLLLDGQV
jgi:hypothetical protein